MKRRCETCTHYKCFINLYCSPEWKPLVSFYKESTDYPPGATIFSAGDEVKGIYQIYSGKIKVVSTINDTGESIVRLATAEQLLGHRGLGGNLIYPVTAITLEASQITFIPLDIFYSIVKANRELAFHMMMFYADELKASEQRMKMMSMMQAKEKVALALLTVIDAFGYNAPGDTMLGFTPVRKDLASLAATTYETLSRVLGKFAAKNVIALEGKSIRVLNESYLKKQIVKYMS